LPQRNAGCIFFEGTKSGSTLNSDVQPTTKESIKQLSQRFDCSTGEVVDYLLFCWQQTDGISKAQQRNRSSKNQLEELTSRISALETNLNRLLNKSHSKRA
jgi:hypothetical protein